jgi:DNA-binding PucR family transcriptional regulator
MFGNLAEQMGYMGGFSDKFTDLHKLDKYLLQAKHAANMHNQSEDEAAMLFFQDYILDYFLQAGIETFPLEMLYSKGLQTLLEYDRRRNTEYTKTLDIWLRNEMNLTQTAKEIFIQRSSLVKRLDKIKHLTGEDLTDPDIRLYYRICFHLMKN